MSLSSSSMQLSSSEKRWLPWFGKTGKLTMGWGCWLNRSAYPVLEQTFEAIAHTRVQLLHNWTREQWEHLSELAEHAGTNLAHLDQPMLHSRTPDPQALCSQADIVIAAVVIDVGSADQRHRHQLGQRRASECSHPV